MTTAKNSIPTPCPMAAALELIGDRWSLVILRDIIAGKHRYGDLVASPEGIPTNILANRLRTLEESGLIQKRLYQERPIRHEYMLTPKGADFLPVLQQLSLWGLKHLAHTTAPAKSFYQLQPAEVLKNQESRI